MKTSERRSFVPKVGEVYRNTSGTLYECMEVEVQTWPPKCTAVFRSVKGGWECTAHGIGIYPSGLIDWDRSTGGRFVVFDSEAKGGESYE